MMTWSITSIFRSCPARIRSRVTLMSASDAREQRLCVLILCGNHFLSVNAKQLEQPVFQAGPNRCESDHGCQSWLNANCSQGVISSARRFAKPEVRGANPCESASFQAPVPQ